MTRYLAVLIAAGAGLASLPVHAHHPIAEVYDERTHHRPRRRRDVLPVRQPALDDAPPHLRRLRRGATIVLEGDVTSFLFGNPHSMVHLRVADPDGDPHTWAVEWRAASRLRRLGWTAARPQRRRPREGVRQPRAGPGRLPAVPAERDPDSPGRAGFGRRGQLVRAGPAGRRLAPVPMADPGRRGPPDADRRSPDPRPGGPTAFSTVADIAEAILARGPSRVLLLSDFDGTLCEFRNDPESVQL